MHLHNPSKYYNYPMCPQINKMTWLSIKKKFDHLENILKKVYELHFLNVLNGIRTIAPKNVRNIVLNHISYKSDNSVLINLSLTISNDLR